MYYFVIMFIIIIIISIIFRDWSPSNQNMYNVDTSLSLSNFYSNLLS